MAGLASVIAENILQKLEFLAYEELCFGFHIKSKLTELEGTIANIKAILLDAEEKQVNNRTLRIWLSGLKDIFYDAEDVLDEVECEVSRKQMVRTFGCASREVCDYFPCCSALAFLFQLGHKIKNIRERLDNLVADKDKFNLVERVEDRHVMYVRRDTTHSFVRPSEVIGRENDKKKIMDLLLHPDYSRNVNVIPIVGIGGLGKTTIAQMVFNAERVAHHFELRRWVCVSEDFVVERLIREIIESACGTIDENLGVDLWQSSLQNYLNNKKCLLVLDDVWNDNREKWDVFIRLFNGAAEGSRIIVTTRSRSVASIVGTVPTYTLEGLCYDDCLSLFVKSAFKEGEDKQYPNLLEIGKKIVEKCGGIPLAIRSLGSLLFSKVDEWEWKTVRDSEIWKLVQGEDVTLPALKLSYDHLPSRLKPCFALCSLFPKDHWFHSGELVAFWMAHGLLTKTSNSQNLELEEVGDMYIKDLLYRSFFQEVEDRVCHYEFKMHDLMHDLACQIAEECSTVDIDSKDIASTVHHLSFSDHSLQVPNYFYELSSGVRTTLFPTKQEAMPLVEACISRFKYLRMLHLSDSLFEVLSSFIGALKHLRYLSLARNRSIKELPNSICKLYNLQTLLLDGCWKLKRLPKDIRKMINLRRLTVTTTYTYLFEDGVYCLNSLWFLGIYGCPRLEVLFKGKDGCLNNLRTLVVSYCDRLTSLTLDIKHLTALETLVIRGCEELRLTGGEDNGDLKLSLQKLKIECLQKLEALPQWLQGSANTLQFVSIKRCENFKALPEWLPSSKSLQTLEIVSCPRLSSLPEGMNRHTVLRELTIRKCPKLIRKCKDEDWSKIATLTLRLID